MKWWMMAPLLVALALPAAVQAEQTEQFQMDKPLNAQQALQLILFESLLSQIRYEREHGRDPMAMLMGKTPLELLALAANRMKAEREAAAGLVAGAAPAAAPATAAAPVGPASTGTASTGPASASPAPAQDAFPVKNTRLLGGPKARVIGEITNNSGRAYKAATFTVRYFDAAGALLGSGTASVADFGTGQTKSFAAPLANKVSPVQVKSYKVEFESGQ